jgi:hypothetical protein
MNAKMTGSTDLPSPPSRDTFGLRIVVFFLVSAGFTTIYLVEIKRGDAGTGH